MRSAILIAIAGLAAPASAEVISAAPNGFELRHSVTLVVAPDAAYAAFTNIGGWWDPAHSYSGKAANLSLEPRAGGCFCERLESGGGVEHMRVAMAMPGERMLLTGSLGPLLYEATAGAMDVRFDKAGSGTKVTMTYRVAGFANGGAVKLAPLVDQVLGQQMRRYRQSVVGALPQR